MLRKGFVLAVVCLLPAMASAQVRGPWEVELSGSGSNGNKFDGFQGALNADIGYFFNDNFELGVRQSIVYNDLVSPRQLFGSTRIAADFHLPFGDQNQFLPFAGVNLGYVYGKPVRDTWELAPEIGLKWFVGPDAFLFIQAEYQFFFRSGSGINGGFKNGEFVYTGGVGFRF